MAPRYDAVIFDLGDVLFDWNSSAITALPKRSIHMMMSTTTWHDFERNLISADEAYAIFGAEHNVDPALIRKAIDQCQSTLHVADEAAAMVHELELAKQRDPRIKLYVMSNIAQEHLENLQQIPFPWHIFDKVFSSCGSRMRKPDLAFYRHVIDETGCDPVRTLYLDDKAENICAGRMLGLRGEIVNRGDRTRVFNLTRNLLLNDAPQRAEKFLRSNAGKLDSVIIMDKEEDILFQDNFSQLIIWGLTSMEDIIYLSWPDGTSQGLADTNPEHLNNNPPVLPADSDSDSSSCHSADAPSEPSDTDAASTSSASTTPPPTQNTRPLKDGLWKYFARYPLLTTSTFPPDADTTATAYLNIPPSHLHRLAPPALVGEALLSNRSSPEGYFETYFAPDRPRVSPEVCVNILRFFARYGQQCGIPTLDLDAVDERVKPSVQLVLDSLAYRAGLYGSRYYTVPEAFLYYTALLCVECRGSSPKLSGELEHQLRLALMERMHVKVNPLGLAMRVRACQVLGFERDVVKGDLESLLELQERDNGWPAGDFCSYGKTSRKIGSRGLTTAMVWRVLKDYEHADE